MKQRFGTAMWAVLTCLGLSTLYLNGGSDRPVRVHSWGFNEAMPVQAVGCSLEHVWQPNRLLNKGCLTVSGLVRSVRQSPDGDYHAQFNLDPPYRYILTRANYSRQQGYLVVEDPCHFGHGPLTDCDGWSNPLPVPERGKRYQITGNWVLDRNHHNWAEIHGLSAIEELK